MGKSRQTISLRYRAFVFLLGSTSAIHAQQPWPHVQAHAHNDYEHHRPLHDALDNGFASVEADVHWQQGKLLVAHNQAHTTSPSLEALYFKPLDSLITLHLGQVYEGGTAPFYLMIDIKTESTSTYQALKDLLDRYPRLRCSASTCAVKIFLSGERPVATITREGYTGFGIDGRPEDLGKGTSNELMPVVSDTYKNWSTWKGQVPPDDKDLQRIKDLARRVHAEGKKLRLWAIPDQELAWKELLNVGVDFINTDHLHELNTFLSRSGL